MAQFTFTKDQEGKVVTPADEIEHALLDLGEQLKARLYPDQAMALQGLLFLFQILPDTHALNKTGWESFIDEFRELEEILEYCEVEVTEEAYKHLSKLLAIQRVSDPSLTLETLFSRILLAIPMPVEKEAPADH